MSDKDNATRVFLSDREVFSDAFNGTLFNGRQIVRPQDLSELDPNEILLPEDLVGVGKGVERRRDMLKQLTLMSSRGSTFAILGIEGQSNLDYSMPVRMMLYDAITLARQVRRIHDANHKKGKAELGDLFTSGLLPGDRLAPVFTLVAFLSPEPWTAPRCLKDLLMDVPKELEGLVQDYRLNLLCPYEMRDDDIRRFRSDLAPLLFTLKHNDDHESLLDGVENEPMFRSVKRSTLPIIRRLTGYDFEFEDKKEVQDMATGTLTLSQYVFNKGLQEGRAEGLVEGKSKGLAEGKAEGLAEGKAEGLAEGKAEGLAEGVVKIMLSMNKEPDEICEQLVLICKMSPEQARQTLACLSNGN